MTVLFYFFNYRISMSFTLLLGKMLKRVQHAGFVLLFQLSHQHVFYIAVGQDAETSSACLLCFAFSVIASTNHRISMSFTLLLGKMLKRVQHAGLGLLFFIIASTHQRIIKSTNQITFKKVFLMFDKVLAYLGSTFMAFHSGESKKAFHAAA